MGASHAAPCGSALAEARRRERSRRRCRSGQKSQPGPLNCPGSTGDSEPDRALVRRPPGARAPARAPESVWISARDDSEKVGAGGRRKGGEREAKVIEAGPAPLPAGRKQPSSGWREAASAAGLAGTARAGVRREPNQAPQWPVARWTGSSGGWQGEFATLCIQARLNRIGSGPRLSLLPPPLLICCRPSHHLLILCSV